MLNDKEHDLNDLVAMCENAWWTNTLLIKNECFKVENGEQCSRKERPDSLGAFQI